MLRALSLLLIAGALAGCWRGEVVRVVDGVELRGRFITDAAYACYLRGAEWEARGRYEEALAWYRQAARWDAASPEIWTRIGALSCRQEGVADAAQEAFEEAHDLDPAYEPLWRERARCAERRGQLPVALAAARQAVALEPSEDTVLLLVDLLQQGAAAPGGLEEATRWLRDLTLRHPDSVRLWTVVQVQATRTKDEAWLRQAQRRLAVLNERLQGALGAATEAQSPWQAVDEALARGSLAEARTRLRRAHLDSRLLAARALAVGRPELARQEAALRAAADPRDADAQVALALAAELLADREVRGRALEALARPAEPLGDSARWIFAELLWRRVGAEAARLWLGKDGGEVADLGALRARLRGSIDPPPPAGSPPPDG